MESLAFKKEVKARAVAENNKIIHKIFLIGVKYIPIILTILSIINTIFSYFGIYLECINYFGGISLSTLVLLYLSSMVFKFCKYQRLFIHYLSVTWGINIFDTYIGIPITDFYYLILQLSTVGILALLILYEYVRTHKEALITNNKRY